jgi:hypothetical protein
VHIYDEAWGVVYTCHALVLAPVDEVFAEILPLLSHAEIYFCPAKYSVLALRQPVPTFGPMMKRNFWRGIGVGLFV